MAPLLVNNEVIGASNLGSKETYVYSENDFIFVQQLADQLAVCINNTRLYAEVSKSKREWRNFQSSSGRLFSLTSLTSFDSNSQDPVAKSQGCKML